MKEETEVTPAEKQSKLKKTMWQLLENQMIYNAKALEASEALKISR